MRNLKQNPILRLVNSYIVDSPQPTNISYLWNFGSLLALCLGLQIVTGIFLVMHYTPHTDLAFNSVEHIMRDVDYGWALRYTHANVASFFFIFVYAHIARGLYYNSYKSPRVAPWTIGVIILVLMMATAFLGYCLVYGQMSLWGATVITNLLSAIPWIGKDFVEFIWGGFSVGNATLNRFFSLHYLLPFILAALAIVHLLTLHTHGSRDIGPKFLYLFYLFFLLYFIFLINIDYFSIFFKQDYNKLYYIISVNLAFIIPNIRAIKRIGPHNEDIISVLVGSLLGDGNAERLNNGGVRFTIKQSDIHKNYFFLLYYFFNSRGYCNNNIPVIMKQHLGNKLFHYYYFRTYSFTSLLWLYNLFYNHNKNKVIPVKIVNYLTPLALAVWIQDDGYWHDYGVRISTNCFLLSEINLLVKALETKFNLKCSIHKNGKSHQIYIKAESIILLRNLVLPHFDKSMYYKLGI
jgi:hypothetical protein